MQKKVIKKWIFFFSFLKNSGIFTITIITVFWLKNKSNMHHVYSAILLAQFYGTACAKLVLKILLSVSEHAYCIGWWSQRMPGPYIPRSKLLTDTVATVNWSSRNCWGFTCQINGFFIVTHWVGGNPQRIFKTKIVSEYDQEIPQSQTADNPMAPWGRATQSSLDTRKTN